MSTNMTLIETKTVGSGGAANIDFTGLGSYASLYTDLKLLMSLRSNDGTRVTTWVNVQFNNSTSNRSWRDVYGTGSSALSSNDTTMRIGAVNANNATANTFGNAELYIPNFSSANYKSASGDGVSETNATATNLGLNANLWSDTAAITSIKLIPGDGTAWVEGSSASLYGISAVTSTPKATGGIISQDATYWYHTFPFSSTFTPTTALTNVDYLVVAGGGAGGVNNAGGGGGGAGGLRCTVGATGGGGSLESKISLNSGTAYTITVGAGGAGITNNTYNSTRNNGTDSSIAGTGLTTITSTGGGGGSGGNVNGGTGGSGGGADGGYALSGGSGTTNQGYAGGNGSTTPYYVGGGGGGAGAAGNNGNVNVARGGNGVLITDVANATYTGVNGYYAGGGNGGGENPSIVSTAGSLGGGGVGGRDGNGGTGNGTNGVVNTGSGGGGAEWESGASKTSGAGGSGLVVIRYAK